MGRLVDGLTKKREERYEQRDLVEMTGRRGENERRENPKMDRTELLEGNFGTHESPCLLDISPWMSHQHLKATIVLPQLSISSLLSQILWSISPQVQGFFSPPYHSRLSLSPPPYPHCHYHTIIIFQHSPVHILFIEV